MKQTELNEENYASNTILIADQSAAFGDKKAVGNLAGGMSVRWVDDQLTKGMPHIKLGPRRVRFDLVEVRAWLKTRYGQVRRGPAKVLGATK